MRLSETVTKFKQMFFKFLTKLSNLLKIFTIFLTNIIENLSNFSYYFAIFFYISIQFLKYIFPSPLSLIPFSGTIISKYEPTYNLYRPLQQDLNRVRHVSQNQSTLEMSRQIIHPRRNRNFQTPRIQFNIPPQKK